MASGLFISLLLLIMAFFILYRLPMVKEYCSRLYYRYLLRKLTSIQQSLKRHEASLFLTKDKVFFDFYEVFLSELEFSLNVLSEKVNFPFRSLPYEDLFGYVYNCELKAFTIHEYFNESQKECSRKQSVLSKAYIWGTSFLLARCYFCSSPTLKGFFKKVHVSVEGEEKKFLSCGVCRCSMNKGRGASILYFNSNGQRTHWSQTEGYLPSPNYWLMNRSEK